MAACGRVEPLSPAQGADLTRHGLKVDACMAVARDAGHVKAFDECMVKP